MTFAKLSSGNFMLAFIEIFHSLVLKFSKSSAADELYVGKGFEKNE